MTHLKWASVFGICSSLPNNGIVGGPIDNISKVVKTTVCLDELPGGSLESRLPDEKHDHRNNTRAAMPADPSANG